MFRILEDYLLMPDNYTPLFRASIELVPRPLYKLYDNEESKQKWERPTSNLQMNNSHAYEYQIG